MEPTTLARLCLRQSSLALLVHRQYLSSTDRPFPITSHPFLFLFSKPLSGFPRDWSDADRLSGIHKMVCILDWFRCDPAYLQYLLFPFASRKFLREDTLPDACFLCEMFSSQIITGLGSFQSLLKDRHWACEHGGCVCARMRISFLHGS